MPLGEKMDVVTAFPCDLRTGERRGPSPPTPPRPAPSTHKGTRGLRHREGIQSAGTWATPAAGKAP